MMAFFQSLREPSPALTRAQQVLFAVLALGIALTRIPALSLTLHDWDEILFASAVREYDVQVHHPHPPGYPLFVAAAKGIRLLADSDFRAVQIVAMLASMLIFPVTFFLAKELRFSIAFAFGVAAMTAFLPPLWYYGGTGFSDVPALMLILLASALLLRGGCRPGAYFTGALVTAFACGIRPHLLLVAAVPALLGGLALSRRGTVLRSWLAAGVVVSLAYLGAAFFTNDFPNGYLDQARYIGRHIGQTDSFRNPHRPPLAQLAPRAFLFPVGGGRMKYALVALAAIGLANAVVRRKGNVAVVLGMFLPMTVFTWLMLDVTAWSRYAIAYASLHAFLAVAGAEALAALVPRRAGLPLFIVLSGFVTWSLIKWTWPALRFARTEPSPVVAAFEWIRTHVPTRGPRVYVQGGLLYHAAYFIPDHDYRLVFDERTWREEDFAPGNIFVFEGQTLHPQPRMFVRKRLQLWEIARPRFFEVGIVDMRRIIRFGQGWHLPETDGHQRWRWMRREAQIVVSPAINGLGDLRLKLHAPVDATPRPPVVTVMWNGSVVDRIQSPPDGDFDLRYTLPSRNDAPNELRLSTDQPIVPRDDGRELGLNLLAISWTEASP